MRPDLSIFPKDTAEEEAADAQRKVDEARQQDDAARQEAAKAQQEATEVAREAAAKKRAEEEAAKQKEEAEKQMQAAEDASKQEEPKPKIKEPAKAKPEAPAAKPQGSSGEGAKDKAKTEAAETKTTAPAPSKHKSFSQKAFGFFKSFCKVALSPIIVPCVIASYIAVTTVKYAAKAIHAVAAQIVFDPKNSVVLDGLSTFWKQTDKVLGKIENLGAWYGGAALGYAKKVYSNLTQALLKPEPDVNLAKPLTASVANNVEATPALPPAPAPAPTPPSQGAAATPPASGGSPGGKPSSPKARKGRKNELSQ